jgi:hypothetical protein
MTGAEAEKILEDTVARLAEHFDAVQIMASWQTPQNCTACGKRGSGNWYARQGMAQEFIDEDQARTQAKEIGDVITPSDEGDGWKKTT